MTWTRPRALCHLAIAALLVGSALSASADRPSLIDLQATVDQMVTGLCDGDAATCGAAPTDPAVGAMVVDPSKLAISLDLVHLAVSAGRNISCSPPPCVPIQNPILSSVDATVLQGQSTARLTFFVLGGITIPRIEVSLPGEGVVLTFDDVVFDTVSQADEYDRVEIRFDYSRIRFDWGGQDAEWDLSLQQGLGCEVESGHNHVDLAGNSPDNLGFREIEATYQLRIIPGPPAGAPIPMVSLNRTPLKPCYLRGVTSNPPQSSFEVSFERLWENNDQFPVARQAVDTTEMPSAFIQNWSLTIKSGLLREQVDVIPHSGDVTYREFDPATGAETATETTSF